MDGLHRNLPASDELSVPSKKSELGKYLLFNSCLVLSVANTFQVRRLELPSDVLCADRENEGKTKTPEDPGAFERDRNILPAVKAAKELLENGMADYPKEFKNRENLDMIDCDEDEMWEFPIKTAGVYLKDFKKAGPDRVIFDKKGVVCQIITHRNVKKNGFRECWLVTEEDKKTDRID